MKINISLEGMNWAVTVNGAEIGTLIEGPYGWIVAFPRSPYWRIGSESVISVKDEEVGMQEILVMAGLTTEQADGVAKEWLFEDENSFVFELTTESEAA